MDGAQAGRGYEDLVGFSEIVVALVGCHYFAVAFCAFGFHFGGLVGMVVWVGLGIWILKVQKVSLLVLDVRFPRFLV